ncbi:hypothetical protein [Candidatus Ruminimicrobiellum ovillum]|uniref:hypothetical protein n=1 Tax=Candidatus Ruminimicrobiellum ovillum TaxID=1947927 RepID=UPI0035593775
MKKETIEKIIEEYEADKENKGFITIVLNNDQKFGQTPATKTPLSRFELLDDETLAIEFAKNTTYIPIADIDKIFFRPKLF